jgi:hypothetical protein
MEIDYAFLADSAEVINGKTYVMGGSIDSIWAKQVPVVYPKLSFVLRIVFEAGEIGRKHNLEIQIMDEDGSIIATVGGDMEIPGKNPQAPKGWRSSLLTVLNFANLQFPKFGTYNFNILADNFSLKSIPFRIAGHVEIPGGTT